MKKKLMFATSLAVAAVVLGSFTLGNANEGAGGRPFVVEMTGAQEAPGPGDADGTGTAVLIMNPGLGVIHYTLTVENIAPATAAHIHRAPAGVPGPVVVPLTAPTSGSSSGTATVSRELILEMLTSPEEFYVNVHNADFPPGAVRGQLSR